MKITAKPKKREAIKAWNRKKIIDATIELLSGEGIKGATVAKIVELADVSTGLINAHFQTMDTLFDEVLSQMANEYKQHWRISLQNVSGGPVSQLEAMVLADLDPKILNLKTMGVWFVFRAMARARPEYVDLVGTREPEQMQKFISLFQQLNEQSKTDYCAEIETRGLIAMLDGIWTDYYLYPNDFDREKSIASIYLFLNALYPGSFHTHEFYTAP